MHMCGSRLRAHDLELAIVLLEIPKLAEVHANPQRQRRHVCRWMLREDAGALLVAALEGRQQLRVRQEAVRRLTMM